MPKNNHFLARIAKVGLAVSFYPQVAEGLQTAIQEGNDAVN